jgi:hypothetical protein
MLDRILKWRRKILIKFDSTEAEIKSRCAANHQVSGTFHGHEWQLCLMHVNGPVVTEITESAARFNSTDYIGVVAFWTSMTGLSDYLFKRGANDKWLQKGGRPGYMPHPPALLAASPAFATDFNLNDVATSIKAAEEDLVKRFGKVPIEPSLLPYDGSVKPFKLAIKVFWNGKK